MKTIRHFRAAVALGVALAAAASLAGCFSDDEDEPPAVSTSVPDAAGASGAAFVAFLLTLGSADESSEPLSIGDTFAVPADETSEPAALS